MMQLGGMIEIDRTVRSKILAVSLTVGIIVVLAAAIMLLPESAVEFWFGTTVDHCPDSDLSCPSHEPGALVLVALFGILILWLLGGYDD